MTRGSSFSLTLKKFINWYSEEGIVMKRFLPLNSLPIWDKDWNNISLSYIIIIINNT